MTTESSRLAFVTGATGYIGGRLVPRLLDAGWSVRCLARSPAKLADRTWSRDPRVTLIAGGLDAATGTPLTAPAPAPPDLLTEALRGCQVAYYLIHSMISAGAGYVEKDRQMAARFAAAAGAAGVRQIIYLGGLGETGEGLSRHLASRIEVARILADGPTPVTTLRAAMIIGSGSASFEILRYLVERLPVMITPRWVRTECQPIAIRNVLHYLVAAPDVPATSGRTLDIGGPDIFSYHDIMRIMAEELHVARRLVIPVPFLTPKLSSLWIHLITPLSRQIAGPLAEGLKNRVVAGDDEAHRLMPQSLLTVRESIQAALVHLERGEVETSWSAAGVIPGDPDWAGGQTFVDQRQIEVRATPHELFGTLSRLGGKNGWYSSHWLWRARGWLDLMVGGPGLRRGRRNPTQLAYGEALDFWRVTGVESDRRIALRAEMRLPGEALLEFLVEPVDGGCSRLTQIARFRPRGLFGLLYWWVVSPFHGIVFQGMLRGIARATEAAQRR
ncbi:MAG: SDR family oxidoreductase [Candidatus Eisenbacteria bacterium]|nr:SDR family oxidoreductase [Candidatus Eisenbacteria bacterium]